MAVEPLVGRGAEAGAIDRLIRGIREGGGALVIRGEAGVGKTALLGSAVRRAAAAGTRVLQITGVECETNLPFAALHQLVRPFLGQADGLPAAQRDALFAAFGRTEASVPPDVHLVGLAALDLLTDAAGRTPLLIAADDAQWLDRPSAEVLLFVARRVQNDPIVILATARTGADRKVEFIDAGLLELRLNPLPDGPAGDLLDARFPGLAPTARERLLAEAAGNPLALLELPAALGAKALDGEAPLPSRLPLTVRLERAFAARAAHMPDATRQLLLVAAAEDTGVVSEVLAATGIATGTPARMRDLAPALEAGLTRLDGAALRFRHPLVRSAVYQAASVAERHAAHAALAEVLGSDPDRRAWHRAAAAIGRDPEIAADLAGAAERARRRGDLAGAMAGYERAAALTAGSHDRGVLLLAAAEAASELGRSELVRRLLREADALELSPAEHARSLWVGDLYSGGSVRDPAPVRALVEAARTMLAQGANDLAADLLVAAARRCYWGALDGPVVAEVVEVADGVLPDRRDPRLLHILAHAAPLERGAEVLAQLADLDPPKDLDALRLTAVAAAAVGAWDQAFTLFAAAASRLREEGRLGALAQVLAIQAWAAIMVGTDLPAALTAAEEGTRLAVETARPSWELEATTAQAAVAALRGDAERVRELAARIESKALFRGAASNLGLLQYARGLLALGAGRHEEAYEQLRRMFEPGDPANHRLAPYMIGELAEAAARCGRPERVWELLREIEPVAERTGSPWLRAVLGYARAVLAEDESAEECFRALIADPEMARWPFLRARARLAFGEWLRRRRRAVDARPMLRAARDAFDELGMTPWGERARQELGAAGETSQVRRESTLDVLTAQELQIVHMAADGLSNRDIGQRLYLSHRTVESHLYRAYPKLGITSRAQLPRALASSACSRRR